MPIIAATKQIVDPLLTLLFPPLAFGRNSCYGDFSPTSHYSLRIGLYSPDASRCDKRPHLLPGGFPMKLYKVGPALVLFGFLWANGVAQQPEQQPMDIWRAMQVSLKGAKSITPKNGF